MFASSTRINRNRDHNYSSDDSSVTTLGENQTEKVYGVRRKHSLQTVNFKDDYSYSTTNDNNDDDEEDDDLRSVDLNCPTRKAQWRKESIETKEMIQAMSKNNYNNKVENEQDNNKEVIEIENPKSNTTSNQGIGNENRKRKVSCFLESTKTSMNNDEAKAKSSNQNQTPYRQGNDNNNIDIISAKSPNKQQNKKSKSSFKQQESTAISPATETLNELSQMNTLSDNGNDLRFDFSQLSQLTSNDGDNDGDNNDNNDDDNDDDNVNDQNDNNYDSRRGKHTKRPEVIYKGKRIYLGLCPTKMAAKKKKDLARAKIRQWTTNVPKSQHPSVDWVKLELERLQIREVKKEQINFNVKCKDGFQCISLGDFTKPEGKQRIQQARAMIDKICQGKEGTISSKEIKAELERLGIRKIQSNQPNSNHVVGSTVALQKVQSNMQTNVSDQDSRSSQFIKICLPEQGTIGMYIVDEDDKDYCVVRSLTDHGQARRCGVHLNDELFHFPENFDDNVQEISDDSLRGISSLEMRSLSQSTKRPITFLVRRCKTRQESVMSNQGQKDPDESFCHMNPSEVCASTHKGDNVCQEVPKSDLLTRNEINNALKYKRFPKLPFCRKCNDNTGSTKLHHYLCPKHEDFNGSGAKDKLLIVIAGVRDNCKACMHEFKFGKKSDEIHNSKCGRSNNISSKKTKQVKVHEEKKMKRKEVEIQQKKHNPAKKDHIEKSNHQKAEKKSYHQQNGKTTTTIDRKVKAAGKTIQTKVKAHPKIIHYEKVEASPKVNERREKVVTIDDNTNIAPVTPITPKARSDISTKPKEDIESREQIVPSLKITDDSDSLWVSCPNPWGDRTHQDGDFVLISPSCYNFAREVQGTKPRRFVVNPFDVETSEYHRSHKSPSNGCSVLELQRDSLALRSWGFTFAYHDFGGACLVTSVEPYSPAEDARDIGQLEKTTALNINDMILCINGKKVGGMTELDLEVELDLCGKEVILTVAKTKMSTRNQMLQQQEQEWSLVNSKRIQWCEIGKQNEIKMSDHQGQHQIDFHDDDFFESRSTHMDLQEVEKGYHEGVDESRSTHVDLQEVEEVDQEGGDDESVQKGQSTISEQNAALALLEVSNSNEYLHTSTQSVSPEAEIIEKTNCVAPSISSENVVSSERVAKNDGTRSCIHDFKHITQVQKDLWSRCFEQNFEEFNETYLKSQNIARPSQIDEAHGMRMDGIVHDTIHSYITQGGTFANEKGEKINALEVKDFFKTMKNSFIHHVLQHKARKSKCNNILPVGDIVTKSKPSIDSKIESDSKEINTLSQSGEESDTEAEWEDDENPWLGCICGKTHERPIPVFWIQCDSCDAWYNCAERCVGFSKNEAKNKDDWQCPDCAPNDTPSIYRTVNTSSYSAKEKESDVQTPTKNFSSTPKEISTSQELLQGELDQTLQITPIPNGNTDSIRGRLEQSNGTNVQEIKQIFDVGMIVNVTDRTWVGSNKPGGVAKILDVHVEENENEPDDVYYDVQYVLESRKEFGVEAVFVSIDDTVVPDFGSPAGSTRSSRVRNLRVSK